MIDIILSGAKGQMGRTVRRVAATRSDVRIIAGFDKAAPDASTNGESLRRTAANVNHLPQGVGLADGDFLPQDISLTEEEYSQGLQGFASAQCAESVCVLVDFSHPSALFWIIDLCVRRKLPAVICTTGLSEAHFSALRDASEFIPVFYSSNMSRGAYLLNKLVKIAASELYKEYDVEITEAHHSRKADAPSGTAIALFNSIKSAVPEAEAVHGRTRRRGREGKEIGIHSIRGGGIAGVHEVLFAGKNDSVTLTHNAFSRDAFAAGALDAAIYIADKKAGLYNMESLFGN